MAILNPLWEFLSLCTKYVEAILSIKHGVIVKRESYKAIPHTEDLDQRRHSDSE